MTIDEMREEMCELLTITAQGDLWNEQQTHRFSELVKLVGEMIDAAKANKH